MFESARLKLTAWYLLIIMLISIFFSVVIFQISTNEIERVLNRIEYRRNNPEETFIPNPPPVPENGKRYISIEDLEDSKSNIFYRLLFINGIIFVLAGGAGYFLAGKTLYPIRKMVEEQDEFISNASHELRTPIATMRAEMEALLLEKRITEKQCREIIVSNLEEVQSLQEMTDNLLTFSHTQDTTVQNQHANVSIKKIFLNAEKKVHHLAKQKQIVITNDAAEVHVKGNKQGLIQLFVILLDNAIKYSPRKSVIHIGSEENPNTVTFFVTDKGIGIKPEDMQRVFKRFYRADKSRSQIDGYGLGLSIAKKIVEMHKGSIHVNSKENEGTTFIVTLPKS